MPAKTGLRDFARSFGGFFACKSSAVCGNHFTTARRQSRRWPRHAIVRSARRRRSTGNRRHRRPASISRQPHPSSELTTTNGTRRPPPTARTSLCRGTWPHKPCGLQIPFLVHRDAGKWRGAGEPQIDAHRARSLQSAAAKRDVTKAVSPTALILHVKRPRQHSPESRNPVFAGISDSAHRQFSGPQISPRGSVSVR